MDISSKISSITEANLNREFEELAKNKDDSVEAAKKFESLLATMLVKELRKGLGDGLFGKGAGSDIYAGWFDKNIGEALANDGGLDMEGMIRVGIESKIAAAEHDQVIG